MTRKRVLSGMHPTGRLHMGHLFGAPDTGRTLQGANECFFFVADWHAWPTAHASKIVSGSYRLNESKVGSIPASSAQRANRTHPSISGNAAAEPAFVVATREVSCAVFMPTSPPFGNIQ